MIHNLIEGNWTYEKEGILDETHLRFYTYKEIIKLFKKAGYSIQNVEEVLDPQYEKFSSTNSTSLNLGRTQIKDLTPEQIKQFFVFQYKVVAIPIKKERRKVNNIFVDENLLKIDKLLIEASEVQQSGDIEIALKLYDEILKMSPGNIMAHIGMGDCYMKLQHADNAKACFDKAIQVDPNNSKSWLRLGLLALNKNDNKKADICFNKCLDNDPINDRAYCGLGMVRVNLNDLDGAVHYFCKSLDSNFENLSACKYLLEISYKLKKFGEIENYLNKFIEFHPANLNMRFGLAGIQYKTGNLEDALKNLEYILALDPEHDSAQEMLFSVRSDAVLSK